MKPPFIVVDIETTGLSPHKDDLHGISICLPDGRAKYFAVSEGIPDSLRTLLADPEVEKVGHNLRFDYKFLKAVGIPIMGRLWCTRLMAYAVNENLDSYSLKTLAPRFFGVESLTEKNELDRLIQAIGGLHVGQLCEADLHLEDHPYAPIIGSYACEDTTNTLKLFTILGAKLKELSKRMEGRFPRTLLDYFVEEVMPLERVLADMELEGIAVDRDKLKDLQVLAAKKVEELRTELSEACADKLKIVEKELYEQAMFKKVQKSKTGKVRPLKNPPRFNWGSDAQVKRLFYDLHGVPKNLIKKTRKGNQAIDKEALQDLAFGLPREHALQALIPKLTELKEWTQMATTYAGSETSGFGARLQEVGGLTRIFTEYNAQIVTGRLSSSNPNLQNLPRNSPIKKIFRPMEKDAVFIYADYSQIELRIAAHLSQEKSMMEPYLSGGDPHALTAAAIFGKDPKDIAKDERQVGKTINFLLIYDGSAERLFQAFKTLGLHYSIEQCRLFRERFFESKTRYRKYLDEVAAFVRTHKLIVSETGRVRRLPDIVYGDFLDWRKREANLSEELRASLLARKWDIKDADTLSPKQYVFECARRAYGHAKKQAFNFGPQSMGATICKRGMIELHRQGYKIRTTVHDMVCVEVPRTAVTREVPLITEILERAYPLSVPVKVDVKVLTSLSEEDLLAR